MSGTNQTTRRRGPLIARVLGRLAVIAVLAAAIGWVLNGVSASLDRSGRPAGFARGFIQGVLMPMSMPNLLVGRDVTIYSTLNTGVPYKCGYTVGVNACGLVFFGFFFWRLNRWRRRAFTAPGLFADKPKHETQQET